MLQCQGCHLADGAGEPGRVPDLRNRIGAYLTVEGGREYLVRVPGAAQSVLDDARLAAVLNWMIRKFGPASVAADFEHFDAAEVQQYRAKPLIEVEAERERLLAQISAGQP
jgi:mono/diheme cytochrome c family protein